MSCELCVLVATDAPIFRNAQLSLLLIDDAAYPGFCRVVSNAHVREMSDLTAQERNAMMEAVWQVELALRAVLAPHKINVASLGNMTPHVHWHVIPRFEDDAHFPQPVWAQVQRAADPATLAGRRALLPQLRAELLRRFNELFTEPQS